jgi:outer membrane immunogenic protein
MRAFLVAGAALIVGAGTAYSADLPVKTTEYIGGAPYNWTGCYIGAQVGYAIQRDQDSELAPGGGFTAHSPRNEATPNGVKAGGFLGCNWQIAGPWVVGAELDGDWADIDGGTNFFDPAGDNYRVRTRAQASLRGRVGYAIDRTLYYATGGGGAASIRHTYIDLPAGVTTSFSDISGGITGGFGVEYAFLSNWTGRLEYRYADFGNFQYKSAPAFGGLLEHHRVNEHALRLGLALKFGGELPRRQY